MIENTRLKDVQVKLKMQGGEIQILLERFELCDHQQCEYNAKKEIENQTRFDYIWTTLDSLLLDKSMKQHHEESTRNIFLIDKPLDF